jgi:hypothetical protein
VDGRAGNGWPRSQIACGWPDHPVEQIPKKISGGRFGYRSSIPAMTARWVATVSQRALAAHLRQRRRHFSNSQLQEVVSAADPGANEQALSWPPAPSGRVA